MLDTALKRWGELSKDERLLDPEADQPPAHC